MKLNNLIVKIFLGIYLVIIIAGVVVFENIGFAGGGLEKSIHTASNSETQPVTVKDINPETISKTTPAATVKETASSQDTFTNGRITNTSALKSYHVTGASYVNMHKDKNGSHSFAVVPGGTTGFILSVGAYYTLIDYNGTSGYVYNSYLEVY